MPAELWVLLEMPSCVKQVDGFAARSESPFAQWRQKHIEAVSEYERFGVYEPDTTQYALSDSDSLRKECEDVLNYILDDTQPPDARFASPQDTWKVFLQASRSGDKATIAECFAAKNRAEYMSFIEQLTPAQLAQTAESFTDLQHVEPLGSDMQEGWVKKGNMIGIAHFVKTGRGWLLSQLP
jgi:hypothetical protein